MSIQATNRPVIRPAKPDEAPALSDLAFRSKGHWGYDPAFLRECRADLTIRPDEIKTTPTRVAEVDGRVVGFYVLAPLGQRAVLDDLFVEPEAIGHGYGRMLWEHASATARQMGCTHILLEADPNAEPFYLSRGAVRVGEMPSSVRPERRLPLLRFDLPDE